MTLQHLKRRALLSSLSLPPVLMLSAVMSVGTTGAEPLCDDTSACFQERCFEGVSDPRALSVAMSERAELHIAFLDPVTRALKHRSATYSATGLTLSAEEVIEPNVDVQGDELIDTDLVARHDELALCGRRRTPEGAHELVVWVRSQEGAWRSEVVADLNARECELVWFQGQLHLLASAQGGLYAYQRTSIGWVEGPQNGNGEQGGADLKLIAGQTRLIATHRSQDYSDLYRSTSEGGGVWLTQQVDFNDLEDFAFAGVRSAPLEWSDGLTWILHGQRDVMTNLDTGGDVKVLMSQEYDVGEFTTYSWVPYQGFGGANAAVIIPRPSSAEEAYLFTRQNLRNPVISDNFGLYLYRVTQDFSLDETYNVSQTIAGSAEIYVDLEVLETPYRWPLLVGVRRASSNQLCSWWLQDEDHDGAPDTAERELGLSVGVTDSDQDGRTDGVELLQGTNPLAVDEARPLSWPSLLPLFEEPSTGGTEAGAEAGAEAGIMGGEPMGGEPVAGTAMGGEPMGGELVAGTAMGGEPMGGELVAGTAMGGEPMGGELVAGTAMGGEPMGGEPVAGTAMGGEPMGGEPVAGTAMGGEPMGGELVAGTAMGGEPVGGELVAGTAMGGEPMGGEPVAGTAMGGEPMGGELVAGTAMGGEPMGGEPVAGEPIAGEPIAGEPVGGEPTSNTSNSGGGGGCDQSSREPQNPLVWALLGALTLLRRRADRSKAL